jgi:serine/threonine-protein kinase
MSAEQSRARTDKLIGEVLANRYQIEHRLGEGAMGVVYRARHVKVGRPFAVKVLHAQFLADDKVAQRFDREAELAGRLRHPNVIGVVDVGETTEGYRYMVMDYVQGSDLATLLAEAPMPPQRIVPLVRQMLEGLYHAHEQGLIHRDFKPENVIVERDTHGAEVPRIVDFGIAILRDGGDSPGSPGRLTTNGLVLGTPHYMAPEQAVADPVDHRIDLFALGIVIYEMLCGKLPFDGSGVEVSRANLVLDPPRIAQRVPDLEVDPLLEAFARTLMAKARDARPATAKAARELLDLIDRDRVAAAAVLGVPVEPSLRLPAMTAPVIRESQTPPQAPPLQAAIAEPELATDPVSELQVLPRRRALTIAAAVIGVVALGIAIGIVVIGSNDDAEPLARGEGSPVVAMKLDRTTGATDPHATDPRPSSPKAPRTESPDPRATSAVGTKPSPDLRQPSPDLRATRPPSTDRHPAKSPVTRPSTDSRAASSPVTKPSADPRATKASNDERAASAPTSDDSPKSSTATRSSTCDLASTKSTGMSELMCANATRSPDAARPESDEAAGKRTLYSFYVEIGSQLPALGGSPEAAKIRELYSLIQIQDALKTPRSRADGTHQLEVLRARIVALKSQP